MPPLSSLQTESGVLLNVRFVDAMRRRPMGEQCWWLRGCRTAPHCCRAVSAVSTTAAATTLTAAAVCDGHSVEWDAAVNGADCERAISPAVDVPTGMRNWRFSVSRSAPGWPALRQKPSHTLQMETPCSGGPEGTPRARGAPLM